tara:strand:- start:228 stop:416 length:189 start_codon:yes stop_codon:yes gene_type:complete
MRIDIEYKDIVLIRSVLKEKEEVYRNQLLTGYTDESTSIDTINEIETKQKRISKIFEILNQY